ncbi:MAG: hypothetical protein JXX14_04615 [Deltaproteobacteria bacterium]|nr:hypothetical protein [Deltaproteobacteria bacterium]
MNNSYTTTDTDRLWLESTLEVTALRMDTYSRVIQLNNEFESASPLADADLNPAHTATSTLMPTIEKAQHLKQWVMDLFEDMF